MGRAKHSAPTGATTDADVGADEGECVDADGGGAPGAGRVAGLSSRVEFATALGH